MKNEKKIASAGKKRRTRLGGYNILISLVLVVIIVVVNLVVNALPATYTKFDTSSEGYFTISEETEEIVAAIDKDVTIYYLKGSSSSTYADWTLDLLDRYKALNSHIKVETIDPVLSPNFYQTYTDTAPSEHSLIAVSEIRSKVIDYSEIYVATPNYNTMSYDYSYAGESAITSALDYITSEDLPTVYTIEGNGEMEFPEVMTNVLSEDNVSVSSISLIAGEGGVPSDADCVIIYAPSSDLSEAEITHLDTFMASGGKVILVTDYTKQTANLDAFTAKHGLVRNDGLVYEGSSNYYLQYPYYLLPVVNSSAVTDYIGTANMNVILPYCHGISAAEDVSGVTVESLISTSESAFLKTDLSSKTFQVEDSDIEGSYMIAARAVDDTTGGELIWFSSPQILSEEMSSYGGYNLVYFLATVELACEKDTSVSIAAKTLMSEALVVPDFSANLWMSIMCIIVPVGLVGAGLYVWYRRRTR